jgi:hypothetical protein
MEIISAEVDRRVEQKLEFFEPFASQNRTEYLLSPDGGVTEVRWTMDGPMPFMSKLMSVFVSMDAMIGPDFERGLAKLKQEAENTAKAQAAARAAQEAAAAASAASAAEVASGVASAAASEAARR